MTPNEKAKELIKEFFKVHPQFIIESGDKCLKEAKQYVLIHIKQTILMLEFMVIEDPKNKNILKRLNFYDKVESEIRNYEE
jgi:hypothetical protein